MTICVHRTINIVIYLTFNAAFHPFVVCGSNGLGWWFLTWLSWMLEEFPDVDFPNSFVTKETWWRRLLLLDNAATRDDMLFVYQWSIVSRLSSISER